MTAKDLKNALLQEAVQGKLVPQIPSDGNARELLEEIRKEKYHTDLQIPMEFAGNKNVKSGDLRSKSQIRVTKKELPEIPEDEIPFDIPESWCWCRLGEIVYNNGQKTPDKEFSYIDIGSIDNEHQKLNEKENFIQPDKAPSRARKIVKKGDVIYSTVRPYLHNMCIIDKEFQKEPIASTGFAVMTSSCGLNNKYLFYYLLSPTFDNYANATDNAKGVAYPAINDDKLYKGLVPLPPLAEQKRIVAAIEKFMPLIEEYGKKEAELTELNAKISTLTKKAILQEAVQGKLVPQIADEGNARELLEEIRKEKYHTDLQIPTEFAGNKNVKSGDLRSKSQIRVTKITEDEIPFDIPESWCWCRLGEIFQIITGSTPSKASSEFYGNEIPFYKPADLDQGLGITETSDYLSKVGYEKTRKISPNSVLVCCIGSIGKTGLINKEGTCNQQINAILNNPRMDMKYVFYLMNSSSMQNQMKAKASMTTLPILNKNNFSECCFPLPPLNEQKRIVAVIENILPLCEKLGQ